MNSQIRILSLLIALILGVSCSSTYQTRNDTSSTPANNFSALIGTERLLSAPAGPPVVPNGKASLSFIEAGRAAGNASCNRFTGSTEITGTTIKFGQLAATRMS